MVKRAQDGMLYREGNVPFAYIDLAEGVSRPQRWAHLLNTCREENQGLMAVDRVEAKAYLPATFTVV
eukprot:7986833-Lingulodinium_polyedra.AAC.1